MGTLSQDLGVPRQVWKTTRAALPKVSIRNLLRYIFEFSRSGAAEGAARTVPEELPGVAWAAGLPSPLGGTQHTEQAHKAWTVRVTWRHRSLAWAGKEERWWQRQQPKRGGGGVRKRERQGFRSQIQLASWFFLRSHLSQPLTDTYRPYRFSFCILIHCWGKTQKSLGTCCCFLKKDSKEHPLTDSLLGELRD